MKKIITVVCALFVGITILDSCGRRDIFVSYDQIGTDASMKKFRRANKQNQLEILNNLLDQAEKEYKNCETVDDLVEVRERVDIISLMNENSKQIFIPITRRVRSIKEKINGTIAEVTGQTIIQMDGGTSEYRGTKYRHR
ncbi:MAG: hypothetical protein IJP93_02670 [Bacteroidales bacterium]|nr:hypothetical protein [Bacteroidales bacterium]